MIGVSMKIVRSLKHDQRGMASFMVTTVLILMIGLIVIGFSQVAQRNQRETLDRQLSTQAFYAAESGVQAAMAQVRSKMTEGLPPNKTECQPDTNYPDEVKLSGNDVKVTCMLITAEIDNLMYTGVTENTPTIVPLISASGEPFSQINISWENDAGASSVPCTASGFTAKASWSCGLGVLRADVADAPNSAAQTAIFDPLYNVANANEANAPAVGYGSGGGLAHGYCSNGASGSQPKCFAKVTGLSASTYYMALRSIYKPSTVTITAQNAAGQTIDLLGQVQIDVTAKAQDVLRRIQVRMPLEARETSSLPAYAIESTDSICKRFAVEPGYYSQDTSVCN